MEIWQAILVAFGGNAALLAVLALGGKTLITHWLTKSSTEHQIKFSKFTEKQADAIATTYALIRKFNSRLKEYLEIPDTTASGSRGERKIQAVIAHREFLDYFEQKQIYLSKKSVVLISQINSESKSIFDKYLYQIEKTESTPETAQEWLDLIDKLKNEIEVVFLDLENEFRSIVGNES
jgi:predicted transcriptional regulator